MRYKNFEDMPMWQNARELVAFIYTVCDESQKLKRDFGVRDQLQRATLSIMNNIAEGFDSPSNRVVTRYLTYSAQSCSEVISISYVLEDVFHLAEQSRLIRKRTVSLREQIKGFIKYLGHSPRKAPSL